MLVSDLITVVREDYLDDRGPEYGWNNASLLRKFTEAERQACNRANLLYDDLTTSIVKLTLVSGQASYSFSSKITAIENIIFAGKYITKATKEELDATNPTWRTDTGMAGKNVYAVLSGRTIRLTPIPDADDAGELISLEVYRLPLLDIEETDQEPEIPSENHRDLVYWVLHECYKKQDLDSFNQEKSDYYLSRFNEIFGSPVSALVRQHQFESPRILTHRPASYMQPAEIADEW